MTKNFWDTLPRAVTKIDRSISLFLFWRITKQDKSKITSADLYIIYCDFCDNIGSWKVTLTMFSKMLAGLGYIKSSNGQERYWKNVKVLPVQDYASNGQGYRAQFLHTIGDADMKSQDEFNLLISVLVLAEADIALVDDKVRVRIPISHTMPKNVVNEFDALMDKYQDELCEYCKQLQAYDVMHNIPPVEIERITQ